MSSEPVNATADQTPSDANDYPLSRVPQSARYGWFQVAVQRFGQISALSQFLLGSALGFSMTFWDSFWAITLGAIILEMFMIFVGFIGVKEGLNTSILARWVGFGSAGSAVIGLILAISLIGWFGIQSGVSAAGLSALMPFLPEWAWALIFGLVVTAVVLKGFLGMQWVANITVPIFIILVGWAVIAELSKHPLGELISSPPPGEPMPLLSGVTLVAGSFIAGAVITPDMTRYNRTRADVVKQTVVGITIGEYAIGLSGVLLAHAVKSADINNIIMSSVGWVGIIVIVFGTLKINDWNLYSGGLGIVNFIDTVFHRKVSRPLVTGIIGVIGTVLAAFGILNFFTGFLTLLSVTFPPIVGILLAEYFLVKKWRPALDATREDEALPETSPTWVPATLVIWLASSLVAYFVPVGLGPVNAVVVAFALYFIAGKLNLLVSIGESNTAKAA
ncbi:MAG: cytosine permease [Propionibacteriaceae bacterium]|jgi:cytosine permease|nr:cytosine permease [Propionibacteriaceae bacterium]